MQPALVLLLVAFCCRASFGQEATPQQTGPLGPGDHSRVMTVDEQVRNYVVHVPKSYDPKSPTPVVLVLPSVPI